MAKTYAESVKEVLQRGCDWHTKCAEIGKLTDAQLELEARQAAKKKGGGDKPS